MITGLYAALSAFGLIALIFKVARLRIKHRVVFGAGKNEELEQAMRAHGNFVETVPIALILIGVLELSNAYPWILHWLGFMMVLSRISHYVGLTTGKGHGPYRMGGMLLTFAVYAIGGLLCLLAFFGVDLTFLS